MVQPIIIAAGGTGGHLFPAEALAAELIRRGERVALMTDARSAAYDSPVFANAERFVLQGSGLSGRGVGQAMRGASALLKGTLEARRHIRDLSPSAIVGFGGYPSFPPIAAARLMRASRRPALILHEQNAVLGRANRLMARGADLLALSYADTAMVPEGARSAVVGNPVRPALAALAGQPYPLPAEGTGYDLFCAVMIKGAPEPEAARAFLDWAVTPESQELLAASDFFDVPTHPAARIHPIVQPFRDARLIDYDFDWAGRPATRQAIVTRFQNEILAGRK
jgi:hypothetical protein